MTAQPNSQQSCSDRAFDRMHYMEAWLTGYNACRDGVPDDFDAIMARVKADHEDSGAQRARKVVEHQGNCDATLGMECICSAPWPRVIAAKTGEQR